MIPGINETETKQVLLIGLWVNRNWILGNWIKELKANSKFNCRIWWVASVYAKKHWWEKLVKWPLPKSDYYYFSYPSIFESYLTKNPKKFSGKSIVNYTHNTDELGGLNHQASILNMALSVHFNCSKDMDELVHAGLDPNKAKLVLGAIDDDCVPVRIKRERKSILLASRFGERKGLEILPEIVSKLPDWKFIILGREWENFLSRTGLLKHENVEYYFFNLENRNILMSRASVFLSLSHLEGGPIPLIESIKLGCIPIATNTGFAKDVIKNENGIILNNPPSVDEVIKAIEFTEKKKFQTNLLVKNLNWNRIANILDQDIKSSL